MTIFELSLSARFRLRLSRSEDGALLIDLEHAGDWKDGHGWGSVGSRVLRGEDLTALSRLLGVPVHARDDAEA